MGNDRLEKSAGTLLRTDQKCLSLYIYIDREREEGEDMTDTGWKSKGFGTDPFHVCFLGPYIGVCNVCRVQVT